VYYGWVRAIRWTIPWLLLGLCRAQNSALQDSPVASFGTTVVNSAGLRGEVYHIPPHTSRIPRFDKLKPRGSIYIDSLNIPARNFTEGFPGVTKRFEWFAIDYTGRFWIEKPGPYDFSLISDDGSRLYIDDRVVIDNDGIHPPIEKTETVFLDGGIHLIRVSYFQGPRTALALVLRVAGPGEEWRVFSTDEFRPPPNPEDWKWGSGRSAGQVHSEP
jgi:PA14 domain